MRRYSQLNRAVVTAFAWSVLVTGIAVAGPGNYNQQGSKLVGVGSQDRLQGVSLGLSADGNTALVGAEGGTIGGAWVYVRNNGVWTQQGNELVGSGYVFNGLTISQGQSVALSADGNTAVIGGSGDNSGVGAVWVFTRSGSVWTQQGSKLVATGATAAAPRQGWSVAISADGNTFAEGAPFDRGGAGTVWVFKRSGGVWTQGSALHGNFTVGCACPGEGISLAMSGDGNTISTSNSVQVAVFAQSGGVWTQQGPALQSDGDASQSLTYTGNTLLSGGYRTTIVFYRKGNVWSLGQILPIVPAAISADGTTVVGGNPDGSFQVALYVNSGGVWSLHHEYVGTGAVETGGVGQGSRVALSANGDTMIEAGFEDNNALGAAWVFAAPQLALALTHSGNFAQGQTGRTYTITLTNVGDRDIHADAASAVNVVDNIPSGLMATDIEGSGWSCTLSTVSCTRSDGLAKGASFPTVTVTVNVASNAPASVTNAATASGGGSNWGNAKDVTIIVP